MRHTKGPSAPCMIKTGEDRRKKKREVLHLFRCYTHTQTDRHQQYKKHLVTQSHSTSRQSTHRSCSQQSTHRSCSRHQMLQTFWTESLTHCLFSHVLLQYTQDGSCLEASKCFVCKIWWWPSSVYSFCISCQAGLKFEENRRNASYVLNYRLLTRHHSGVKPVLHWFSSNMFQFKCA